MHPQVTLKRKLGQNTAEYLIMLTLVAVGSIALVTVFGKTVQQKIAMVTAAISGDTKSYGGVQQNSSGNGGDAANRATEDLSMKGIATSDLDYTSGGSGGSGGTGSGGSGGH